MKISLLEAKASAGGSDAMLEGDCMPHLLERVALNSTRSTISSKAATLVQHQYVSHVSKCRAAVRPYASLFPTSHHPKHSRMDRPKKTTGDEAMAIYGGGSNDKS